MVRCDGHAYTFGPLLAECHPHVYRDNCHAQYYWMIDGAHPNKLRTPIIPGFKLVKVWEPDPDRRHPGMSTSAADLADTFVVKPEVCSNIDEVTEDIDAVFINNCNGDGSVDVSDAVYDLLFLFANRPAPIRLDALDANDDGRLNSAAAVAAALSPNQITAK